MRSTPDAEHVWHYQSLGEILKICFVVRVLYNRHGHDTLKDQQNWAIEDFDNLNDGFIIFRPAFSVAINQILAYKNIAFGAVHKRRPHIFWFF